MFTKTLILILLTSFFVLINLFIYDDNEKPFQYQNKPDDEYRKARMNHN